MVTTHKAVTDTGQEAGWIEVFTTIDGRPVGITARPPVAPGSYLNSITLGAGATLADALAALAGT